MALWSMSGAAWPDGLSIMADDDAGMDGLNTMHLLNEDDSLHGGGADFSILVSAVTGLTAGDFVL